MVQGKLSKLTNHEVNNVLIFISDSHRYDELPNSVREMGVAGRATATSGHTPAGYPSILTGLYPSSHQVWGFDDSLSERPQLLAQTENSGIDATHVWSNVDDPKKKPPLSICGESQEKTIDDMSPPFVLIVHDRGGHMQYGHSDKSDQWETHWDFFNKFEARHEEINRLYREGVDESVKRFQSIIDKLKTDDLFNNTLCIFTSDHGEILGEYGGLYTHGAPLVPEVVDVPLVFLGAGLPRDTDFNRLLSTTDIAPTALSALGSPIRETDGRDLWTSIVKPQRVTRAEMWTASKYPFLMSYKASSIWTEDGGHVRHLNRLSGRIGHATNRIFRSPFSNIVRKPSKGQLSLLKSYLSRNVTYGTPPSSTVVDECLETDFSKSDRDMSSASPDTEQLRQMGYLE